MVAVETSEEVCDLIQVVEEKEKVLQLDGMNFNRRWAIKCAEWPSSHVINFTLTSSLNL